MAAFEKDTNRIRRPKPFIKKKKNQKKTLFLPIKESEFFNKNMELNDIESVPSRKKEKLIIKIPTSWIGRGLGGWYVLKRGLGGW